MKCQTCGGANVVHETKALYYNHDGRAHAAGAITGHFCQQCGTMRIDKSQLTTEERAARRQALRNLMGLNKHREGGPVDGLEYQLEQRAEW